MNNSFTWTHIGGFWTLKWCLTFQLFFIFDMEYTTFFLQLIFVSIIFRILPSSVSAFFLVSVFSTDMFSLNKFPEVFTAESVSNFRLVIQYIGQWNFFYSFGNKMAQCVEWLLLNLKRIYQTVSSFLLLEHSSELQIILKTQWDFITKCSVI